MTVLDGTTRRLPSGHTHFVAAMVVDAVGTGLFLPISLLYFTATTHLSLIDVGAAITAAGLLALPMGPLAGGLVDRYGARPLLQTANVVQGLGFAGYLLASHPWQIIACAWISSSGRAVFSGCYGVTVTALAEPGLRERWFGWLGSARNLGYAVGGLLAAAVLTIGTVDAYRAIVALNAISFAASYLLMRRLPNSRPERAAETGAGWMLALGDRRYRLLIAQQLCVAVSLFALNVAIPVYAVAILGLPSWVAGLVFLVNTCIVGLGQGVAQSLLTGRIRSHVLVLGHGLFATGYGLLLLAAVLPTPDAAIAMVIAGVVAYTLGEVVTGPVTATIAAEAAPGALRGRYLSLNQLAVGVAAALTPIALTSLLAGGPPATWLTLAGVSVVGAFLAAAAGAVVPAARSRIGDPSAV